MLNNTAPTSELVKQCSLRFVAPGDNGPTQVRAKCTSDQAERIQVISSESPQRFDVVQITMKNDNGSPLNMSGIVIDISPAKGEYKLNIELCKPAAESSQENIHAPQIERQLQQMSVLLESTIEEQAERLDQVRAGQTNLMASGSNTTDVTSAAYLESALEAGGDYFECSRLSDDQYGFFVADVSGHDLGVAYTTGALRALAASFINETLSVSETMLLMNSALKKFLPIGQYVTACYAKYDSAYSTLDLISAGHPPALLQRCTGEIETCDLVGDILGMFETVRCQAAHYDVSPKDRLFLYTDGLIEGYSDTNGRTLSRKAGMALLNAQLQHHAETSIGKIPSQIVRDFRQKDRSGEADDMVLLGVEFRAES